MNSLLLKSPTTLLSAALLGGLCAWILPARGGLLTVEESPGLSVPDGNAAGRARTLKVVAAPGEIVLDVNVTLTLTGMEEGWNGDLYAWLRHDSGAFSVLLNRPGRTAGTPLGYDDNGLFEVVFDDTAAQDVHQYQVSWGGSPGPLTGRWQPDARNVDPAAVTEGSPRTAFLNAFIGGPASGDWTVFVADLGGGFEVNLTHWRLDLIVVPEPMELATVAGVLLLGFGWWRRRARR